MSLPALLLFFFAPVLSALVRVRVGAVLPALIVAASLSVGATALPPDDGEWATECQYDEWTDARKCVAYSWAKGRPVALVFHCSGDGDGKAKGGVFLGFGSPFHVTRYHEIFPDTEFAGPPRIGTVFDTEGESWSALHKVSIRWDHEPPSEAVFFKPQNRGVWTWAWDWAWDERASGPNQAWEQIEAWAPGQWEQTWGNSANVSIPQLLRTKKQLRIRWKDGDKPIVLTFSTANPPTPGGPRAALGAIINTAAICGEGG